VLTGFYTKEIARLRRRNVEIAFLCGLLHDLGKAVLLNNVDKVVGKDDLELPIAYLLTPSTSSTSGRVRCWRRSGSCRSRSPRRSCAITTPQAKRFQDMAMTVCLADLLAHHIAAPPCCRAADRGQLKAASRARRTQPLSGPARRTVAEAGSRAAGHGGHAMSAATETWDVVVIGSGPAGQKAAVQAAKAGKRVCVIERERRCRRRLCAPRHDPEQDAARDRDAHHAFRQRIGRHVKVEMPPDLQLASLMDRMESVVTAHVGYQSAQMQRNGIEQVHGRARFRRCHTVAVESIFGQRRLLRGDVIVIATGSRPRTPREVPVDHEHVSTAIRS
jgi:hypothetical protein